MLYKNHYDVILLSPKEISLRDKQLFRENHIKNDYEMITQNSTNILYVKFLKDNLGIAYLAAYLRKKGYSVCIKNLDMEESIEEACQEVVKSKPLLVGISLLYDLHTVNTCQIVKIIRNNGYSGHITLGGPYISLAYQPFLLGINEVDSVIRGEGEEAIFQLVSALKNNENWKFIKGIVYREDGKLKINDVETKSMVPFESLFPARDMYMDLVNRFKSKNISMRVASIQTSRGCKGKCTYCSAPVLGELAEVKWRSRSNESIVNEINYLVKEFGIKYINIIDENFYGYGKENDNRLLDLANKIVELQIDIKFWVEIRTDIKFNDEVFQALKQAGVQDILLGLESGSQSMLNRWKKGTTVLQNKKAIEYMKAMGFIVEPSMIMVDPYTTLDEFKETINFILETEIYKTAFPFNLFNELIVFPGTEMENNLINDGIIEPLDYSSITQISDNYWEIFDFCKTISSRKYRFLDYTLEIVWNTLIKFTNRVQYILEDFFPHFSQLWRNAILDQESEKETFREFIVRFGRWRRNIHELVKEFLKEILFCMENTCMGDLEENLEDRLQNIMNVYSSNYLDMNVEKFIKINVERTTFVVEEKIKLPNWMN